MAYIPDMTLAEWMGREGLDDERLASLLGVTRATASRYRRGLLMPKPEIMRLICSRSEGSVTANDFIHKEEAAND